MMTEKKEYSDQLERGDYVKFLKEIILNSEQCKRDDDSKSFVMAMDAPWGTGKTFTINLLKKELEKNQLKVVIYSAWKNDFWNNAFEPFAQAVFWDGFFKKQNQSNRMAIPESVKNKIVPFLLALGKGFAKQQLSRIITPDTFEELQKLMQNNEKTPTNFNELINFQEAIMKLTNELNEYTKKGKLIIIIDELDRCKPLFAIETMEIVKHIFDVENLVVLFSLDIQQLSNAVKKVYGYEMDAVGYLMRFFDYISKIPIIDYKKYLSFLNKSNTLKNISYEIDSNFIKDITDIYSMWNLSLRDMNNELKRNDNEELHKRYYVFLLMKYAFPKVYSALISGNETVLNDNEKVKIKWLKNYMPTIDFNKKIEDIPIISLGNRKIAEEYRIEPYVEKIEDNRIYLIKKTTNGEFARLSEYWSLDLNTDINSLLSFEDTQNWEKIKGLKIRDFIYKKLEMYNFSFASDTEKEE